MSVSPRSPASPLLSPRSPKSPTSRVETQKELLARALENFRESDADKSGVLDIEELTNVFGKLYKGEGVLRKKDTVKAEVLLETRCQIQSSHVM